MKRNFTRILAAVALLVFIMPSMVAWGQNEATWDPSYSSNTVLHEVTVQIDDNISATFNRGMGATNPQYYTNGDAVRMYGSNTLTITSSSNSLITQILINLTQSIGFSVSSGSYEVDNNVGIWTGDPSDAIVFTNNTSGQNRISSITVRYSTSGGTPTCAAPTFDPAGGTFLEPQNVTISTATEGATIYYTTNDTEPSTSSDVYSEPIPVSSTTTIKAMAVKADYNNSSVASATYTISSLVHAGTEDDPYTVADARTAIDAGVGITEVYATGIVSAIPTAWSTDYNNITFNFVDNEGDANFLQAYRCVSGTGVDASTVAVGDIVVVYGNLTKYNSTYEFTQGCELVSLEHPQSPTIVLAPTSIDLGNSNATGETIARTFTVSQINLTADVTLDLQGDGALDINRIVKGAQPTTVTWTYTPSETGNINATITATSAGAETQTLTITGAAVAPVTGNCYEKVTEAMQDWSGCYIITGINSGNYYALTGVSSNLGTTAAVTVVGSNIESNSTTDAYQVIVAQTTSGYSLYMNGVGYLGYNSDATTSNNYLHALEAFEANTCEWTISMTDGLATITNVRNNVRTLQFNYNNGNSRFACYTSSQVKPTLFKYTGTVVVPPSISAQNVNIAWDATSGTIAYTVNNPVAGTTLTATTNADWISDITVNSENVTFTTTVNESNEDRTAEFTLAYAGAESKTVTVSQAMAPITSGTGTISFGNSGTKINSASVTGNDDLGNTWTITTVGTTSFTQSTYYSQVGKSAEPAESITFATTLPVAATVSAFEAKFGGFNSTAGDITLKVDGTTYGTGALDGTNDVIASCLPMVSGTVLTVTVTDIAKGVKCYYISYSLGAETYTLYIPGYINPTDPDADADDGYYLIASPVSVNPANVEGEPEGMTDGNFDLYYFNQSDNGAEWKNYEANHFNLVPGKGYLYAHDTDVELTLTGKPYTGNNVIDLVYDENAEFAGWNLIGNPYNYNVTVDKDFYIMNDNGDEIITPEEGMPILPMQGFFVVATAAGQTVTFSKYVAPIVPLGKLVLNLNHNRGTVIDRAIVRFGEGEQLPKFQLFENSTKLYIPQGNSDYAIVRSAAEGEMPVNFKAKENGTYTISVNTENVEMDYLHLIDNMTGTDVDLLQTPSYTFEASTRDYASRFRLVFSAEENGASAGSATFAYFNGNEWVVSNEGEAQLHVIDMTGRIVSTETINGNATVKVNAAPGVYMLRLINGNDIKTQKVIIK